MKENLFFEKINNIGKLLAKHIKKKMEKIQINEIREHGTSQQVPMTFTGSLGNLLKTYIPITWKI
jgi:hypothetical protein